MSSSVKYNCQKCVQAIGNKEKYLKCDVCDNCYHGDCTSIGRIGISSLLKYRHHIIWLCENCKLLSPTKIIKELPLIMDKQAALAKEMSELKEELLNLKGFRSCSQTPEASKIEESIPSPPQWAYHKDCGAVLSDALRELQDQMKRSNNLVFFGLKASGEGTNVVKEFCSKELGTKDVDVDHIWTPHTGTLSTPGSKPLVIVKFKNAETRERVLRAAAKRTAVKARESGVYVSPDYTRKQRDELKLLRSEVARRRTERQKVCLRGFRIVPLPGNVRDK